MWNIYSALAQSTMAAHTLLPALKRNLICASSASDTPWKPVPTLARAQHKLHVSLLCIYSYFKACRSCPPHKPSHPDSVSAQLKTKKKDSHELSCYSCLWFIINFYFCLFGVFCIVIEVFQIIFTALDFTHKRNIFVTIKTIQGFVKVPKIFFSWLNFIILLFVAFIFCH